MLEHGDDRSAWTLANLYLASLGVELLGEDAPRLVRPADYFFARMAKLPAATKQLVRLLVQRWRRKSRQHFPILDLPLPSPPPEGVDWIMAFRRWARGGR